MTALSLGKERYDVLNAVALKKMADAAAIAAACGIDENAATRALGQLSEDGLVVVAEGSALPTDIAEPALAGSAGEHYGAVRADAEVLALVDRFEEVNSQFLAAMSSWQRVDLGGRKVANDHTDSEYDDKVITRIDRLVQRLMPLLGALGEHDPRFSVYRDRFDRAMDEINAGRHEYLSSPTMDSVHNIWFEFHEDLLRTLGRAREE